MSGEEVWGWGGNWLARVMVACGDTGSGDIVVQASTGDVVSVREGKAGEGIDVAVLGAGPVDDCEVKFLQYCSPPCMRPFQGSTGHQPLEGFMVGDKGEMETMDERAEQLACPHGSQAFPLVGGVVLLGGVEGAAAACHHVLIAVVVELPQHAPQTYIGEIGVDEGGAVVAETLQCLAGSGNLIAYGVEGLPLGASSTPLPWCIFLQEVQHWACHGGEVGAVAGVIPELAKASAELVNVGGVGHVEQRLDFGFLRGEAILADIETEEIDGVGAEQALLRVGEEVAVDEHVEDGTDVD